MEVFVVVEQNPEGNNPIIYEEAYATFGLAAHAVKTKHEADLIEQGDDFGAETALNTYGNPSYVYIEKGINIYIMKLPVRSNHKGGKKQTKKRKLRKSRNMH